MDVIFLHGPAAAGKLTTARRLEALVGLPVFHNHLVVDMLTTVFPFGSAPFVRLRERCWLDVLAEAAAAGRSLTFTFSPEPTVPPGFPERVRRVVGEAGGRVRFVRLDVDELEQEARLAQPSRREFHKLTDLATLRRLRQSSSAVEQPPVDLEIDTNVSGADVSARAIADHFALRDQTAVARYPDPD